MRIMLDECVPVQVRNALVGHEVATSTKFRPLPSEYCWHLRNALFLSFGCVSNSLGRARSVTVLVVSGRLLLGFFGSPEDLVCDCGRRRGWRRLLAFPSLPRTLFVGKGTHNGLSFV